MLNAIFLYNFAVLNVLFHNLLDGLRCKPAGPDALGVNHGNRSTAADAEAAGVAHHAVPRQLSGLQSPP